MKNRRIVMLFIAIGILFLIIMGIRNIIKAELSEPVFDGSIILGRPSNSSITANITSNRQTQVYLAWGDVTNSYSNKSNAFEASNLKPATIVMDELEADKMYYYRLYSKDLNTDEFKSTSEYTFRTPRNTGEDYTFVVQSDSHLLNKADKELYTQAMQTMASYKPDFIFDMGDTFLNDQVANPNSQDYETIRKTSLEQRSFFDIVTRNASLFLTIGNHEGEYGYFLDGTDKNLVAMSTIARKTYYPNPVPNEFYSGNTQAEDIVGQPENYYAFQWGDALYVSIDPYRYTTSEPYNDKDGWGWTLGKTQYDWFRKTLEESNAKYKFVFAHHAIGNMRGGEIIAKLYEWGGYDTNGQYLFDQKRPGWGKPVQQIMKDTGVTIFFQGHDHLFAKENVDGVIYQTLPKPAEKIADIQSNYNSYPNADKLMNSGFLKVDVSSENVRIDYYRNYYVSSELQQGNTGIVYSYTVDAEHNINVLKSTIDDLSTYGNSTENIKSDNNDKTKNNNSKDDKSKKSKDEKNGKSKEIAIKINGNKIKYDVEPFIDTSNRIQVPVRLIAEQLGCQVLWEENGKSDTVTIKKNGVVIELKIGEKTALHNSEPVQLDTVAFIKDGKTFVPLRFVSEVLGCTVNWDGNNWLVEISTTASDPEISSSFKFSNGIILGTPTDKTVSLKAIADSDIEAYFEYGTSVENLSQKTASASYNKGDILDIVIDNLSPNTQYYYRMMSRTLGSSECKPLESGTFHTQRTTGETFTFTIQADSHRDENSDISIYETALKNVLNDEPDFHIDLGDTFMGEKLGKSKELTLQRYMEDRAFFAQVSHSVPLFLVNGNHEGENGWNMQEGADNIGTWAFTNRLMYFPNTKPDEFYSGSEQGKGNYYSYIWGDAQFIMLDPFWFSQQKARSDEDGWNYTLGKEQYDWFKNTLETSNAKYKFVFVHNLVGGYGKDARGGAEAAKFFEWGGYNADGSYGFDKMRSGWEKPIHQLMIENKVTAVFHGHDHFYAKQELDGIIYQLVPQPSHPGNDVKNVDEYSYKDGVFLPPAGHLRIIVSPEEVKVDYVKASTQSSQNGSIAYSYTI